MRTFEGIVEKKLSAGLSLQQAMAAAVGENPAAHADMLRRTKTGERIFFSKTAGRKRFATFQEAVRNFTLVPGVSLAEATRRAVSVYPELHESFLNAMKKAAQNERS